MNERTQLKSRQSSNILRIPTKAQRLFKYGRNSYNRAGDHDIRPKNPNIDPDLDNESSSMRGRNQEIDSVKANETNVNKGIPAKANREHSRRGHLDVWNLSPSTAEKVLFAFSRYIRENRGDKFDNEDLKNEYRQVDESDHEEQANEECESYDFVERVIEGDNAEEEYDADDRYKYFRDHCSGAGSRESVGEPSELSLSDMNLLNSETLATSESISDEEKLAILTAIARKKQNLQQNAHSTNIKVGRDRLWQCGETGAEEGSNVVENNTGSQITPKGAKNKSKIPIPVGSLNGAVVAEKPYAATKIDYFATSQPAVSRNSNIDVKQSSALLKTYGKQCSLSRSQKKPKKLVWSLKSNEDKITEHKITNDASGKVHEDISKGNKSMKRKGSELQCTLHDDNLIVKTKTPAPKILSKKEKRERKGSLVDIRVAPPDNTNTGERCQLGINKNTVKSDELISIPSISTLFVVNEIGSGENNNLFELVPHTKAVSPGESLDGVYKQKINNSRRSMSTISRAPKSTPRDCRWDNRTHVRINCSNTKCDDGVSANTKEFDKSRIHAKTTGIQTSDQRSIKYSSLFKENNHNAKQDSSSKKKIKHGSMTDLALHDPSTVQIIKHLLSEIERSPPECNMKNDSQSPEKIRSDQAAITLQTYKREHKKNDIFQHSNKRNVSTKNDKKQIDHDDSLRQTIKSKVRRSLNSLHTTKSAPTASSLGEPLGGSQNSGFEDRIRKNDIFNKSRQSADSNKKYTSDDPVHNSRLMRDVNPRYRYLYSIGTPHEMGPPSPSSFPDLFMNQKSISSNQTSLPEFQNQKSFSETTKHLRPSSPRLARRPIPSSETADTTDYESCSEHEIRNNRKKRSPKISFEGRPSHTQRGLISQPRFPQIKPPRHQVSASLNYQNKVWSLQDTARSLWPSVRKVLKTVLIVYAVAWVLLMMVLLVF